MKKCAFQGSNTFASLKMIRSSHNVQLGENFHHILNVFYCKKYFSQVSFLYQYNPEKAHFSV